LTQEADCEAQRRQAVSTGWGLGFEKGIILNRSIPDLPEKLVENVLNGTQHLGKLEYPAGREISDFRKSSQA